MSWILHAFEMFLPSSSPLEIHEEDSNLLPLENLDLHANM